MIRIPSYPWMRQAVCTQENPDLWTDPYSAVRAVAMHICLTHCPVLAECAQLPPLRGTVLAGIAYNDSADVEPLKMQPRPARRCDLCYTL